MRLVAYYRVSTEAQGQSGNGLEAQRASVRAHAAARGDAVVAEVTEIASGGKDDRALLASVLEMLRRGEADGLIVAKLDRLARSVTAVDRVLSLSAKQGWALVALDLGVDTGTPAGRLVANVLAAVAQWEREQIGARTREGLQAKRVREGGLKGNKASVAPATLLTLERWRARGLSYRECARLATEAGLPTAQGGDWRPGTVRFVLNATRKNDN